MTSSKPNPASAQMKHEESKAKEMSGSTEKNVEDLYKKLGDPGRFQWLVLFLLALAFSSVSAHMVVGVFFTHTPGHECHAHRGVEGRGSTNDDSVRMRRSAWTSTDPDGNVTLTSCSAKVGNMTFECGPGQWRYALEQREASAVSDFDLVCGRSYLQYLSNTLFYGGVMIGSFGFGYLSDAIGRRPVAIATLHALVGLGVAIYFVENVLLFLFLRLAAGVILQGVLISTYTLAVEQMSSSYRSWAGTGIEMAWPCGTVFLAGMAWWLKGWRQIQLGLLAPLSCSVLYFWFLPESLRWLLAKGKTEKAGHVIRKITWFNGLANPMRDEPTGLSGYQVTRTKTQASYLDLLRVPELRKRTLCVSFVGFSMNVGYFGMVYSTETLSGDRYLNFLLGGVVETVAMFVAVFVIVRFGRRRPIIAFELLGGICCLIAGAFPRDQDGKVHGTEGDAVRILSVLARAMFSMLFSATDLFTAELFPTVVRNRGVGVCSFAARVGAMITPQIFNLADYTFSQLPPLVFSAVAVTGAILTYILPETSGQSLPETVHDIEVEAPKSSK